MLLIEAIPRLKVSDHQAKWTQCELRLQETPRKENINHLYVEFPSLNLRQRLNWLKCLIKV